MVKVKKMSKEDILLVQKRVRDEYTKLVPSGNTRKKSAKTNQVKGLVVKNMSGYFNVVVHKLKKGNINTIINVKLVNVLCLSVKHRHGMCTI